MFLCGSDFRRSLHCRAHERQKIYSRPKRVPFWGNCAEQTKKYFRGGDIFAAAAAETSRANEICLAATGFLKQGIGHGRVGIPKLCLTNPRIRVANPELSGDAQHFELECTRLQTKIT
jgi:hypothetical protein